MKIYLPLIGLLYVGYTIIRIRSERMSHRRSISPELAKSARIDKIKLSMLTILEIIVLVLLYLRSPIAKYYNYFTPEALRVFGIVVATAGIVLIGWASTVLDGEYSSVIEFKKDHKLVMTGPYAFMRHPIYGGFALLHSGVCLSLSNVMVLFVWVLGLGLILLPRIPKEDRQLELHFGKIWRDYADRIGPFWPRRKGALRRTEEIED
jgi:protein-S-isoprenylcysteine O-methyltransferase Ste14